MIKFYRRNSEDKQRGSALMEFCILTSCLLLFILQVVDVANLLIYHMSLTQAAREAARSLAGFAGVSSEIEFNANADTTSCSTNIAAPFTTKKYAQLAFWRNFCVGGVKRYNLKPDTGKITVNISTVPEIGSGTAIIPNSRYVEVIYKIDYISFLNSPYISPFNNFTISARALAPLL